MNEVTVTETMSPTIGKLADAMCKAQAMMKPAVKDSKNPFFNSKYADLSAVWEAIRSPFTTHGLAVVQSPAESNGDTVVLDTFLLHTSGEWMKSRLCMRPAKSDPQGIGSCLTYARRYALGAIAGVATEEDDDGNAASKPNAPKATALRDKVIEKAKPVEEAGPVPASVPTSEPPQALPPPTSPETNAQWVHAMRESIAGGAPPLSDLPIVFPYPEHDITITFGKMKGKKLSECPQDYLEWLGNTKRQELTDPDKKRFHKNAQELLDHVEVVLSWMQMQPELEMGEGQ